MLFRKYEKITSVKLYSIGDEQSKTDRAGLIAKILELFTSEFGELPKDYSIHGPYGVPKGRSIGIKAFRNKLLSKGHEKYYGLTGDTEEKFGFHFLDRQVHRQSRHSPSTMKRAFHTF